MLLQWSCIERTCRSCMGIHPRLRLRVDFLDEVVKLDAVGLRHHCSGVKAAEAVREPERRGEDDVENNRQ